MITKLPKVTDHICDLRRYALALTHSGQDTEDLVQETLARAHDRPADFRSGEALRPWLMSILHNIHVDGTRSLMVRCKHAVSVGVITDFAPAAH